MFLYMWYYEVWESEGEVGGIPTVIACLTLKVVKKRVCVSFCFNLFILTFSDQNLPSSCFTPPVAGLAALPQRLRAT